MPLQQDKHARVSDKSGYLAEDTIAAIATQVGGAISIIRVSGPLAFSTLQRLTKVPNERFEPRKMVQATLYSEKDEPLDSALCVRFIAPLSYTGEDLVEYHLHGGSFIAHRLLETLQTLMVRQALPGEFSFRAVRNGKLSLFQAQAIADLISAANENATALALEKMSGTQCRFLDELKADLQKLAVLGEVGIDFADQDIDEVSLRRLKERLGAVLQLLDRLKNSYSRGFRLQEGVSVAFIGLPNAGKSSLFNALLGEDRAIVSEIPGTTRDVIHERLTLRGKRSSITLKIQDTAGLREAQNPIEKIGIARSRKTTAESDLILLIIDPTSPFEAILEQWRLLDNPSKPLGDRTIGILTKSDLTTPREAPLEMDNFQRKLESLGLSRWVKVSSVSRDGITEAIDAIVELCERWVHREKGEILLTRIDHVTAVEEAIQHLLRAGEASEIDLFASDIRQSLHALAPLIGETVPDDILGKIFSDFCIGK